MVGCERVKCRRGDATPLKLTEMEELNRVSQAAWSAARSNDTALSIATPTFTSSSTSTRRDAESNDSKHGCWHRIPSLRRDRPRWKNFQNSRAPSGSLR